jgi:penicillin-binding protein 1A
MLVRVNQHPGPRPPPGDTDTVMEAFKPDEEPDDAYSIVGFTNESGGFFTGDQMDTPRNLSSGRSVY